MNIYSIFLPDNPNIVREVEAKAHCYKDGKTILYNYGQVGAISREVVDIAIIPSQAFITIKKKEE